jgi:hypothetical protein
MFNGNDSSSASRKCLPCQGFESSDYSSVRRNSRCVQEIRRSHRLVTGNTAYALLVGAARPTNRAHPRPAGDDRSSADDKSAEGVGFEPTVGLHLLRFSRPSQSTTLAPLRREANRCAWQQPHQRAATPACLLLADHLVQNVVRNEDRHVHGHRQRDRITRP